MNYIKYFINIIYFVALLLTIYNNQTHDVYYMLWFFLILIYFLFFVWGKIIHWINLTTFVLIIMFWTHINIYQLSLLVLLILLLILFMNKNKKIELNYKDIILSWLVLFVTIVVFNIFFFSYLVLFVSILIIIVFILNNFFLKNRFSNIMNNVLIFLTFFWINFSNLISIVNLNHLIRNNDELWFYWYLFFLILNTPIVFFCLYKYYKKLEE